MKENVKRFFLTAIFILAGLFILSLFIMPLLHPDRVVIKSGIVTNVTASGNPYFRNTTYTLTFNDGTVVGVQSANSIPIPVNRPLVIRYTGRDHNLLGLSVEGKPEQKTNEKQ